MPLTVDAETADELGSTTRPTWLSDIGRRYGLLFAWVVVAVAFSALLPNTYFTLRNFQTIFSAQSVILILAVAFMIPLLTGQLDLSLASVLAITNVVLAVANVEWGWPLPMAILAALATAAIAGGINALLVVGLGLDSIVVTLGVGTAIAGLTLAIDNLPISGISQALVQTIRFKVFGLQVSFYIAIIVVVVAWYVVSMTPLGRHLYFTGAGPSVARLAGIRVARLQALSFVTGALVAGVAGIVLAGLLGASSPSIGPTLLLPGLASVFLGATAFTPGRYNVLGTVAAVYFLIFGITGLEQLGYSGWIASVFYGGSLVVAVVLSRLAGLKR